MASLKNIEIRGDGKAIGGDDNSVVVSTDIHNYPSTKTKLSILFDALKEKFESD